MPSASDSLLAPRPGLIARLRAASLALAGGTALIGLLALVGWTVDNATLESIVPGTISMKANTAVSMVLLAVALIGIHRRSLPWRWIVATCLAIVGVLSLMTLAEYVFGVDLRIDEAVFVDHVSPRFPGRLAPATCLALIGMVLAFTLLHRGRAIALAQTLISVVALTPLTSLCGYLYRTPGMYQNAPYPVVAVNTSVAFILLCLGGLFARADHGPMGIATSDSLAGSLSRKLLPAAIGLPFLTGLLVLAGERTGLYSVAFGSALTVTCCGFFFAGAVCWSALLLARTEAQRAVAQRDLARAARRATQGEHHLRIALETARLGSWLFDPETGVVEGSAQYKSNFGLAPDARLTYAEQIDRIHPDDRDRLRATVRAAIASKKDYHAEYRAVWPDGSIHWLVASGRSIAATDDDDDGRAARMVGVTLDVTADRVAAIERERLLEAERLAREESDRASRMKDEFLATLSHELRTPLSAILGWSQILRRGTTKPDALADGLATIERNARSQAKIVDDLLDMSSIISGKVSLDAHRIDLDTAVAAAIETVRATALAKRVNITFAPDGESRHPIVGDLNRLQQVFWNLLSNAIKFTPREGTIAVRIEQRHSQWQVDVADTGEGITPDFLPFVFDRFRQADASTTRRHGGLGLGLAIVKQLVELHGGKVRVRSEGVGVGATFTVSLPIRVAYERGETVTDPVADVDGDSLARAEQASEPDATNAWDASLIDAVRGGTVLILDDEPDARALLRQLLNDCGVRVIVATTTDEAIASVERDRPDVLVSDIGMPGEDGYEFIRRVRLLGTDRGGDVPAIALTAYARAEDRIRAVRAGFQTHVPKPVEATELVTMIASLVERPRP